MLSRTWSEIWDAWDREQDLGTRSDEKEAFSLQVVVAPLGANISDDNSM